MRVLKIVIVIAFLFIVRVNMYAQISDSVVHLDKPMLSNIDTSMNRVYPKIHVLYDMTEQGLMIRWAPNTKEIWLDGLDNGYILEKFVSIANGKRGRYEPVSGSPIKPWPLEKWKSIVNDKKPYCAAAAQCIYGQETNSPQGFAAKSDHMDNLFGFNLLSADLDRDAAIASGLGYIIPNVDSTYFARFRLRLASNTLSGFQDTSSILAFGRQRPFDAMVIDTVQEGENSIAIQWFSESSGGKPTAYYIERSDDNENFVRLNKQPYLAMNTNLSISESLVYFVDTTALNYNTYYYRVIGINSFARESKPSISVKAMARDKTAPNAPFNVTSQETKEGIVAINWDWKDYNKDKDLVGFIVLKAISPEGPFDTLSNGYIPEETKKLLDQNPNLIATNYYKVLAVDKENNFSESNLSFLITKDEVAPAAPKGLEASIDSNGMVLLTWEPPTDKDVRGYLVHFSNGKDANFAVIPGPYLTQAFYLDSISLNSLTESIYYYVVALDLSYNASEASKVVEAKKPDFIAPTASIFKGYKVEYGAININWLKSTSADVDRVELWRKTEIGEWQKLNKFDDSKRSFQDSNVNEGQYYEYVLRTYDDAGNLTVPQKNLSLKAFKSFYISKVEIATFSKEKEGAKIEWQYPNSEDYTFIIYKGMDKENLVTIKYVNGMLSFLDTTYKKKEKSVYAIKVKAKDGRTSEFTYIEK